VLLGVNVAVIVEVPALPKSKSLPDTATTEASEDAYDHVPVAAVVATVGATIDAFASPNVAVTFDHVNVGVALSMVNVAVTDDAAKFVKSLGVNVAVITVEPAPVTVTVDPDTVATDVRADAYDHVPATSAVGFTRSNGASPNTLFGVGRPSVPRVGVARVMVTAIGSLVKEAKLVEVERVTRTSHVDPASPGVSVTPSPAMVHVPVLTAYDSAPPPSPPLADNVRVCPYVTVDVESESAVDCLILFTVIVVEPDSTELYRSSAAFVAVTVHKPADVADNVEPSTEQPAVPAVVTA
jgi:hypothetical protein